MCVCVCVCVCVCEGLTPQPPGSRGFGSSAAFVSDLLDVQDEHVRAVLPALGHRIKVGRTLGDERWNPG